MSYEPTTWQTGDVVTAEKMNKLEQGVANGGVFLVGMMEDQSGQHEYLLDHTWAEIFSAFIAGKKVIFYLENAEDYVKYARLLGSAEQDGSYYSLLFVANEGADSFYVCGDEDDYPYPYQPG